MAVPSLVRDVKNSVPNQHFSTKYIDTQIKCVFFYILNNRGILFTAYPAADAQFFTLVKLNETSGVVLANACEVYACATTLLSFKRSRQQQQYRQSYKHNNFLSFSRHVSTLHPSSSVLHILKSPLNLQRARSYKVRYLALSILRTKTKLKE